MQGFLVTKSPMLFLRTCTLIIAAAVLFGTKASLFTGLFLKTRNIGATRIIGAWAKKPNPREKASFLNENLSPIESSGALSFISDHSPGFKHKPEINLEILFVNGHTEKQMIPKIHYKNKAIVFAADLIPTSGHLPVPYVMGYDVRPLVSMSEKEIFLKEAIENNYYLFLEHDAHNEIITLKNTEKGVRVDQSFSFNQLFN